jgi:O-antigen/teichoic acid export membrane protein
MASSAITAGLSIAFSFIYSYDLGAQNRGIVGMIFLSSLLFSTVALGGLNLTFRSHKLPITTQKHGPAFLFLSVASSFLGAIFVILIGSIYSILKTNVPDKLLYISVLYAFLSIILSQFFQILLSKGLISIRWKLDLLMIAIQFFTYLLLRLLDLTSPAISVFVAFITSYGILLAICIFIIQYKAILVFRQLIDKKDLLELLNASKNNIRYSTQMAVLDRLDRVFVLVFFPTSTFGVYSFMTGVVSFTRFIPESFSTLIVAKKLEGLESRIHFSSFLRKIAL